MRSIPFIGSCAAVVCCLVHSTVTQAKFETRTISKRAYKRDTSERKTIRKTIRKTTTSQRVALLYYVFGPNIVFYRSKQICERLCVSDLNDKITELYLL